jgi:hypothetical protein
VTRPSAAEQDAALAALTGCITERKPDTELDASLLRLRLVADAKAGGASWAVIGAALGVSGKQAKRDAKALARAAQRDLVMLKRPHHVRRRGR